MLYLIKDHDCNIYSYIANLLNINWHLLFVSGLGQCYDATFAIYMVLGPADVPPEGGPDDQPLDQGGLLPLGHQKWDKTSKARPADDPKFFCWWGSVPRNLWLSSMQRRQNCSHLQLNVYSGNSRAHVAT